MVIATTRSMPGRARGRPCPAVPERVQFGLVDRPPASGRRSRRAPPRRRTCARSAARTRSGPAAPSARATTPKSERPEPRAPKPKTRSESARGRRRDDDQLEDRPAEALGDVEHGRQVRAALPERRAQQHHRRHARVGADRRREAEQEVADQRRRPGSRAAPAGATSVGTRKARRRRARAGETGGSPQSRCRSSAPEDPQALGDRLDAPVGVRSFTRLPSPALPGSGSTGVISAAVRGTPGPALFPPQWRAGDGDS